MSRLSKQLLASGAALLGCAAVVALAQPGPVRSLVPGLGSAPIPGIPAAGTTQHGASAGQFMPMQSPQGPGQAVPLLQQPSMSQAPAPSPRPPKGPTQLIDLPRIDNRAISELIAGLVTRFELETAYSRASAAQEKMLPVPAKVVAVGPVLARLDAHKKTLLLRFGFLRQPGQLPQLWASGIVAPDASAPNVDLALVEPAVAAILASRDRSEADLPISELRSQVINLAYIDADSAVGMLKAMGFNVSGVERLWNGSQAGAAGYYMGGGAMPGQMSPQQSGWGTQQAPQQGFAGGWGWQQPAGMQGQVQQYASGPVAGNRRVRNAELPMVIRMPGPNPQDVGLVGAAADGSAGAPGTGQSGLTTILGATSRLSTETLSSPTTQLMVMYNPDRPEQLGLVRKAIMESIDTPARQLVIEAMVLEVTSSGLRDLGLTWNYQKGFNTLAIGSLLPGSGVDTLSFSRDTGLTQALVKSFFVKVQALVQSGKAEVLARPSVLTLDNRQATIRVGTDIPIATSRDGPSGSESRVSYSFFYLPTGIQLNVRPRIDNEGAEVSLQIDAAVSTTVANLGAQIRSPGDVVLAAAPAVSTRRVQTYARIPNSTPLIIGGLISRTRDEVKDSTPILGELPLIGALFGGKKDTLTRDEVIIVLTPYVLERGRTGLETAMPKDAPAFEYSRDNELFRKNLRLRAEDTLNTAYIRENARLIRYRKLVNRIATSDPSRVENTPLALVQGNRTPGEQTLMTGMLYHVLRKHYDGDPIPLERMQLFLQRDKGEVVVRSLASVLARLGDGQTPESFFKMNPDKCLAITFASHREELAAGNVLAEPEPVTRVVDCKRDRSDWATLLYELNRNTQDHNFSTILIKDESDLLTLSHTIALRRLIQINGGKAAVDFEHLGIGRVLAMPEFGPRQNHLLESDIALYFYLSQHYYRAFEEDFEQGMSAIEKLLRSGELNDVILPNELPPVSR
jgi:type II secretory pathway component GspD/PulD (secretin)